MFLQLGGDCRTKIVLPSCKRASACTRARAISGVVLSSCARSHVEALRRRRRRSRRRRRRSRRRRCRQQLLASCRKVCVLRARASALSGSNARGKKCCDTRAVYFVLFFLFLLKYIANVCNRQNSQTLTLYDGDPEARRASLQKCALLAIFRVALVAAASTNSKMAAKIFA